MTGVPYSYYGINKMVPTHQPKSPWATIGSIGAICNGKVQKVMFDDGSFLEVKIGVSDGT